MNGRRPRGIVQLLADINIDLGSEIQSDIRKAQEKLTGLGNLFCGVSTSSLRFSLPGELLPRDLTAHLEAASIRVAALSNQFVGLDSFLSQAARTMSQSVVDIVRLSSSIPTISLQIDAPIAQALQELPGVLLEAQAEITRIGSGWIVDDTSEPRFYCHLAYEAVAELKDPSLPAHKRAMNESFLAEFFNRKLGIHPDKRLLAYAVLIKGTWKERNDDPYKYIRRVVDTRAEKERIKESHYFQLHDDIYDPSIMGDVQAEDSLVADFEARHDLERIANESQLSSAGKRLLFAVFDSGTSGFRERFSEAGRILGWEKKQIETTSRSLLPDRIPGRRLRRSAFQAGYRPRRLQ